MIDCLAFLIGYILYGFGEDVTSLCVARAFLGYPLVNTVRLQDVLNVFIGQTFITRTYNTNV